MTSTDFFQGMISGTGVILGFTLASQIAILFQLNVLLNANSSPVPKSKLTIFIVYSWFCTGISILLGICLVVFNVADAPGSGIVVEDNMKKWVEFSLNLYLLALVLVVLLQFFSSLIVSSTKLREKFLGG